MLFRWLLVVDLGVGLFSSLQWVPGIIAIVAFWLCCFGFVYGLMARLFCCFWVVSWCCVFGLIVLFSVHLIVCFCF